jgi:hypothetical protein
VNRREHYEEAERILTSVYEQQVQIEGVQVPPEVAVNVQNAFLIEIGRAQVHAALAGVPAEVGNDPSL